MRISIILFLLLVLYGCSGRQDTGLKAPAKPRQLGAVIFNALKTGDFTKASPYFINAADIDFFFARKLKKLSKNRPRNEKQIAQTEKNRRNATKAFPSLRRQRLQLTNKGFNDLRAKLAKEGLSWKQARYTGMHMENTHYKYGIPYADLLITITTQGNNFVVRIPACARFERGWIFSEIPRWEGKAKNRTK